MVTTQKLTLEEFLALPEEKPYLEFIDGEVVQKVAPQSRHSVIQGELYRLIRTFVPASEFRVLLEERCVFGDPVMAHVPDLVVVRSDRLPRNERGEVTGDVRFAPEIAIEIPSPVQGPTHLLNKMTFYVNNGVRMAMIVDDQRYQVTVYEPGASPRIVRSPDMLDLSRVIPGLRIDLDALFAELKAEPSD